MLDDSLKRDNPREIDDNLTCEKITCFIVSGTYKTDNLTCEMCPKL